MIKVRFFQVVASKFRGSLRGHINSNLPKSHKNKEKLSYRLKMTKWMKKGSKMI